ncbi:katanin p80 wd40 repeat-containing subunit b1 [Plakobranchus ocellatus]|uniref:Katanin p80 wd40 repeat-containing subunit b1 n=1 Tax=Plakobranchus ocellatus TaxID=259542 RepID=A0AAV3ZCK5_9GAST|nr:katanin p80 wd40 repeat-containing subunit b1 [Plakobranchus ocellatus]
MATTKKAWKLQDFMAHGADVKCLGLGHKSGRVLVTGGDDRKVNLWSVGKPHSIMSLTGHTTSIESVRFGHDEELVVAGSQSGALKIWDLEAAKILRTLTGHKAGIKSLDFHPYGNFAASGSMDCNVKLWDIRRKGCIFTYKSTLSSASALRKAAKEKEEEIASIPKKIWEKEAAYCRIGKGILTVKFWELESFQCVSTSDADKHAIKSLHFHPEGSCLYSACGDTLKVFGWEPLVCHDVVSVQWTDIADMAIANSQLIAASFNKTNVTTFVVDLNKIAPTGVASKSENARACLTSASGRRSFITERPHTSCTSQVNEPKRSDTPPDKGDNDDDGATSRADIQNQDDYQRLFKENARNQQPGHTNHSSHHLHTHSQSNLLAMDE